MRVLVNGDDTGKDYYLREICPLPKHARISKLTAPVKKPSARVKKVVVPVKSRDSAPVHRVELRKRWHRQRRNKRFFLIVTKWV